MITTKFNDRTTLKNDKLLDVVSNIVQWHYDRNLIDGSTDKDQTLKLLQELGELSDSVCKGKDVRDDLGDMMVVMLNIMERNQITIVDCLEKAYDDIKNRKGKMVNGVFVKEEDL
jgi:NTP pyrophosphatase (non-canonical NTP hydrolase)